MRNMRIVSIALTFAFMGWFLVNAVETGSCSPQDKKTEKKEKAPEKVTMDLSKIPPKVVVLVKTSMGDIQIELNHEKAPISVKNFLTYAQSGHYDGTIFHRVIPTFMIQGGGYPEAYTKDPMVRSKATKPPIKNEAKNGLKNLRGTVSMARTNVTDSGTSQFFINVKDNLFLDHKNQSSYGYAVFGKVVKGMDVVDKIKVVPTKAHSARVKDVPVKSVKIISVYCIKSKAAKDKALDIK